MNSYRHLLLWVLWFGLLASGFFLSFVGSLVDIWELSGVIMAVAYLATFVTLVLSFRQTNKGTMWAKSAIDVVLIACIVLSAMTNIGAGLTAFVASEGYGVPSDPRPVFVQRDDYSLTNHGELRQVSRQRYIVIGVGSSLAWHAMGIGMLTFAAYRLYPR